MFNVQTVNCMQYSERHNSIFNHAMKYTHLTRKTSKPLQFFLKLKRSYLVLNDEQRKQENKN